MGREGTTIWLAGALICLLGILLLWSIPSTAELDSPSSVSADPLAKSRSSTQPSFLAQAAITQAAPAPDASLSPEERLNRLEEMLQSVKDTGQMAEVRSYQNKMMALQLIGMVRLAVIVLVVIAIGFPLTLVLLSHRRVLKFPGISPEIADTLVAVEERQAKLVNILKDLQNEIDYVHSLSVPDLKKLIEQAEKYVQQNEGDLAKARLARTAFGGAAAKPESATKPS